jgi:hypothetical protein
MITWILVGAFFNLFYYLFKLDYFIAETTLKSIDLLDFNNLSENDKNKFLSIKNICEKYDRGEYPIFNIFIDLLLYPVYFIALILSFLDYLAIKGKK